jgi:hypothetical protein
VAYLLVLLGFQEFFDGHELSALSVSTFEHQSVRSLAHLNTSPTIL